MKPRGYRVVLVGCGAVGNKRADVIVEHPRLELAVVVDPNEETAKRLGTRVGAPFATSWTKALDEFECDIVIVATPNAFLSEITIGALKRHKHVLVEGPMGRNTSEAIAMAGAATSTGQVLKVGFNHRYYPGLVRANEMFEDGMIGDLTNIRAYYGHGGRDGYRQEWRGNRELAGGGGLVDHGVHLIDLVNWFAGEPTEVFGYAQTAVLEIRPLEDSAFALLKFRSGALASVQASWTHWKSSFAFEVSGTTGALTVEGLGGPFGAQTLTFAKRRSDGRPPYEVRTVFDEEDVSWRGELDDMINGIERGRYMGTPHDGVTVMRVLDALYHAVETGSPVRMEE